MAIVDWLIGDLPPGMAFLAAMQTLMLVLIWHRMREVARQGHEALQKIMDRFEQSDTARATQHTDVTNKLSHIAAKVNGG